MCNMRALTVRVIDTLCLTQAFSVKHIIDCASLINFAFKGVHTLLNVLLLMVYCGHILIKTKVCHSTH